MATQEKRSFEQESALFGFACITRQANRPTRLRILWSRVFAALFALLVIGWFATAAGLYFFIKHRHGYEEVSYANMLILPFRMDQHREEMGNYHVEKGIEALQKGDFRSSIHLLRIGVARSKANAEGRLILAQIFNSGLRRPDMAVNILRGGLDHVDQNPAFLEEDYTSALFRLMLANQYDSQVIELSQQLLPKLPENSRQALTILFSTIQANIYRGNYEEAEKILDEYGLIRSSEGQWMLAQIRWNRGLKDRAIAILHRTLERAPERHDIFSYLMRYYRQIEAWELIRRYAVFRSMRFPDQVGPHIDLLYALEAIEDVDTVMEEVLRTVDLFPPAEIAAPLSRFGSETGLYEAARIAYDLALQENLEMAPFTLHLMGAHIRSGKYEEALAISNQLAEEKPDWLPPVQNLENGLRALALQGLGRDVDASIFVREFLKNDRIRPQTHIAVATLFKQIGQPEIAREILLTSHRRYDSSQPVLSALVETDIELSLNQAFIDHLKKLLRMRVPDQEVLARAYEELGSDRHLFLNDRELLLTRIEELIVRPG